MYIFRLNINNNNDFRVLFNKGRIQTLNERTHTRDLHGSGSGKPPRESCGKPADVGEKIFKSRGKDGSGRNCGRVPVGAGLTSPEFPQEKTVKS